SLRSSHLSPLFPGATSQRRADKTGTRTEPAGPDIDATQMRRQLTPQRGKQRRPHHLQRLGQSPRNQNRLRIEKAVNLIVDVLYAVINPRIRAN
ncbi:hypothetical protein, partial [Mesorhizobium sp. M1C.F.Ca.ET.189.01.1.1]|uniref:hypothetical protein n=1 Tax=Mesorhizobium sp. M1C.F.Ca.ET.189.01.1.1 TaxID=2563925 RepID=UPI00143F3C3E